MKIVAITLWRHQGENKDPIRLCQAKKIDFVGYFQQTTVSQVITASSRVIAQRTQPGTRQSVALENVPYLVHVHVRLDGLCGTVVCDKDYPQRVAFTYLGKQLNDFESSVPHWKSLTIDQNSSPFENKLNDDLIKFQNPHEADKLSKIQSDLDEITATMKTNIDQILQRGETLDSLMDKSDDLSAASKVFYKQAKKTNQCCSYY